MCVGLAAYVGIAYLVLPAAWRAHARHHPGLADVSRVTVTRDGIPGDPLNVALVGDRDRLEAALSTAGWQAADPLGLRSDVRIAADTALHRPYAAAPVSNLYLFGRREDLAFEQPAGQDPRRRHHVRFWCVDQLDAAGRPWFVGAATFDRRVGLSRDTGQVTHHIAPDVDAERDHLLHTLTTAGQLADRYYVDDFHSVRAGRNGGGDPWQTDGRLAVAVVIP